MCLAGDGDGADYLSGDRVRQRRRSSVRPDSDSE